MEILSSSGRRIVLDGAHVAPSIVRVLDETELDSSLTGLPVCVIALRTDKDQVAVLKTLQGRVDRVICTSLDSAPFRSASELEATAKGLGLTATAVDDPAEALKTALELASRDGWVLAIGSLYLAGALRHELGNA
jgi:folylpolyglutamate synthase/dihydropteroate synthase